MHRQFHLQQSLVVLRSQTDTRTGSCSDCAELVTNDGIVSRETLLSADVFVWGSDAERQAT